MKQSNLKAPFPYFGGKSKAVDVVWGAFGSDVKNYVEPFAGSAAMLLGAPFGGKRTETINDFDGFVANFWRAVSKDPNTVAYHADWPVNENDLFARHSWLVRQTTELTNKLHADPEFYDAKIAGWWCWGQCCWIGSGWCSGSGPWVHYDDCIVDRRIVMEPTNIPGVNRQLPHLGDKGKGINKTHNHETRTEFIQEWMNELYVRLRDVRVTCGDWKRVLGPSITTKFGMTAVFLDPPYEKGNMDYGAGGMGLGVAKDVQNWCVENGYNPLLRIVLCGHKGEHDTLLNNGWTTMTWKARGGYALTEEAKQNTKDETLWCSPNCLTDEKINEWGFE